MAALADSTAGCNCGSASFQSVTKSVYRWIARAIALVPEDRGVGLPHGVIGAGVVDPRAIRTDRRTPLDEARERRTPITLGERDLADRAIEVTAVAIAALAARRLARRPPRAANVWVQPRREAQRNGAGCNPLLALIMSSRGGPYTDRPEGAVSRTISLCSWTRRISTVSPERLWTIRSAPFGQFLPRVPSRVAQEAAASEVAESSRTAERRRSRAVSLIGT